MWSVKKLIVHNNLNKIIRRNKKYLVKLITFIIKHSENHANEDLKINVTIQHYFFILFNIIMRKSEAIERSLLGLKTNRV